MKSGEIKLKQVIFGILKRKKENKKSLHARSFNVLISREKMLA